MCKVHKEWVRDADVLLYHMLDTKQVISSLPFEITLRKFMGPEIQVNQRDVSEFLRHHWAVGTFGQYARVLTDQGYLEYRPLERTISSVTIFNTIKKRIWG